MNIVFIIFFIGFMISEIPRVSYSGTVRIRLISSISTQYNICLIINYCIYL